MPLGLRLVKEIKFSCTWLQLHVVVLPWGEYTRRLMGTVEMPLLLPVSLFVSASISLRTSSKSVYFLPFWWRNSAHSIRGRRQCLQVNYHGLTGKPSYSSFPNSTTDDIFNQIIRIVDSSSFWNACVKNPRHVFTYGHHSKFQHFCNVRHQSLKLQCIVLFKARLCFHKYM